MSFNDELDMLSIDTQELLADETVSIARVRPTGEPDPTTFERSQTLGTNPNIPAVTGEPTRVRDSSGRWLVRKDFTVRRAATTFRPSREGTLTDSRGRAWRIYAVEDSIDDREYIIRCQRVG